MLEGLGAVMLETLAEAGGFMGIVFGLPAVLYIGLALILRRHDRRQKRKRLPEPMARRRAVEYPDGRKEAMK